MENTKLDFDWFTSLARFDQGLRQLDERRRFPRRAVPSAQVSVRIEDGQEHTVIPVDVSQKGLRLATDFPIETGTFLQLEIRLHEEDIFPIRLLGICRWSRRNPEGRCLAGVDLSHSNARSLKVLKDFLNRSPQGPGPTHLEDKTAC